MTQRGSPLPQDDRVQRIDTTDPANTVFVLPGAYVENGTVHVADPRPCPLEQATMYGPWEGPKSKRRKLLKSLVKPSSVRQRAHLQVASTPVAHSGPAARSAMVFGTWGTTSYYHLLIDLIIPLWITRRHLQETLGILDDEAAISYHRVSTHGFEGELSSANAIFEHFMGAPIEDTLEGRFEHLVYGFFYNHRPYHGPYRPTVMSADYRRRLAEFRTQFCQFSASGRPEFLVPTRSDRLSPFVDRFISKHGARFHFTEIDFGKLSVAEQISACGRADGIFGNEGAAFSNQVFLPSGSIVIPVAEEPERFEFHEPLAAYMDHTFLAVHPDDEAASERQVIEALNAHQSASAAGGCHGTSRAV